MMKDKNTQKDKAKLVYSPGIFDLYKIENNLDNWDGFPELMWGLGFEMDSGVSFEEYRSNSKLKLKEAQTPREENRNKLYLLEHASLQIVGNFLFSYWRYLTHWSYGYNKYDVDFLRRVIGILESKYITEETK